MFEKITKKIIGKTKETVKKEIKTGINNQLPKIIGILTVVVAILSFMEDTDVKTISEGKSNITIRNIYIYYNEK